MKIDPDDPILTAYALDELTGAQRSTVEARLRDSLEARQSIDEIQQTTSLLREGFAQERPLSLTEDRRELIRNTAEASCKVVRLPVQARAGLWLGLAAAACLALGLWLVPQYGVKSRRNSDRSITGELPV